MHRKTAGDKPERNIELGESPSSLLNELVTMNEENGTFAALESFANHPASHNGFTCAARGNADDALIAEAKLITNGVDKKLLIGAE